MSKNSSMLHCYHLELPAVSTRSGPYQAPCLHVNAPLSFSKPVTQYSARRESSVSSLPPTGTPSSSPTDEIYHEIDRTVCADFCSGLVFCESVISTFPR